MCTVLLASHRCPHRLSKGNLLLSLELMRIIWVGVRGFCKHRSILTQSQICWPLLKWMAETIKTLIIISVSARERQIKSQVLKACAQINRISLQTPLRVTPLSAQQDQSPESLQSLPRPRSALPLVPTRSPTAIINPVNVSTASKVAIIKHISLDREQKWIRHFTHRWLKTHTSDSKLQVSSRTSTAAQATHDSSPPSPSTRPVAPARCAPQQPGLTDHDYCAYDNL